MNADEDAHCADCGKPLTSQPVKLEQTTLTDLAPNNIQRNALVGCCVLSLLLFFFPLLTIHVPIAGEQDISGYDVFSSLAVEFAEWRWFGFLAAFVVGGFGFFGVLGDFVRNGIRLHCACRRLWS